MQTNLPRVYAIGDVTAKLQLAHTASKQGLMVAEEINSLLNDKVLHHIPLNYANIPRCTFTHPEIGSVGLTEKEAQGKLRRDPYRTVPLHRERESDVHEQHLWLCQNYSPSRYRRACRDTIIGPQAAELIAQGGILISLKAKAEDVESIVFAHPTLSEAIMESLEDVPWTFHP